MIVKIKCRNLPYEKVTTIRAGKRSLPKKQSAFLRWLLKTLSGPELKKVRFRYDTEGMEKLGKKEPALFLMNHSSFIDLKIAATLLYPRPFHIICTSDGFVGKEGLMRKLGCIPAKKFITEAALVRDMIYTVGSLRSSVLMYPEASYSFDGTATPLPDSIGKLVKKLGVPVVMIRTTGAFLRDPLYNMLQLRNVDVSAKMTYVLSKEEIVSKSAEDITAAIRELFTFDNFREQQTSGVKITEPFRADGLNRVLYKCPSCQAEGKMAGSGTSLRCGGCGKEWQLTEDGFLRAKDGESFFDHIPDWYRWERDCVRKELEDGSYSLDIPVTVRMMVDMKCIYTVGKGRLTHTTDGFHLTGCDGKLDYRQKPLASYSLYSDYYWYELGDMICIGNQKALYYCFPETEGDVVAKTRLAAEELYKLKSSR
jgi:1-acyl-sn-glycerol-3-phosphate acyltransferase